LNAAYTFFLFDLFFCLRSVFHWLLTWTRIWVEPTAGIYPWPPDTDHPRSVVSEPCVFIHLDFGRVRQLPIGSGRGLDSPPNQLLL
ncbi:hypothetical protein C8F04DRAFT_1080163, partial [Mycena alexandri]